MRKKAKVNEDECGCSCGTPQPDPRLDIMKNQIKILAQRVKLLEESLVVLAYKTIGDEGIKETKKTNRRTK